MTAAMGLWALVAAVTIVAWAGADAESFTFESPVSDGCHEGLTIAALSEAGWPGGMQPPGLSDTDELIARDLPFDVAGSKEDPWLLALTVGVRFNDLHGHEALDLPALSDVHNQGRGQREHCLRGPDDDGPEGDVAALTACGEFILEQVAEALGDGEEIDLEATAPVTVALIFHGPVGVEMNRYAFHIGRALHAVQDSYTHTFRSEDGAVRHVLNFTDYAVSGDYLQSRDGHPHLGPLDECDGSSASQTRAARAQEASRRVLAALADATGGRSGRLERVAEVLADVLAYEPGCSIETHYCDAPERFEQASCRAVSGPGGPGQAALAAWLLLACAWLCRRRLAVFMRIACAVAVLVVVAPDARGQPEEAAEADEGAGDAAETPDERDEAWQFGLTLTTAGSFDRGALAARVGGKVTLGNRFELGLEVEFNPWFSLETTDVVPGALNVFLAGSYCWARVGDLSLQTTLYVGISALLFDLVGADAGSVGPFIGASLLGLRIELGEGVAMVLEPAEVVLPVPHLSGVPFYYRQYRFAVGFVWMP